MSATEIVPNLWMGGELLPFELGDYDAVVNVREIPDVIVNPRTQAMLWLPLVDSLSPVPYWKLFSAVEFVHGVYRTRRKVLVHCTMGHNRSGLIVGAFLILEQGQRVDDTVNLIRSKRPGALSNATFVAQLRALA